MYSDKVMEHFKNPRNVGEIPDADGIGEVGNPVCGDMMTFYIKVNNDKLEDVKFKTFGCGAAIAVSSMVCEMAKGMTLDKAMKITNQQVADELDGLPQNKMHCSNLGADALHRAIENYQNKEKPENVAAPGKEKEESEKAKGKCYCPVCDIPLEAKDSCSGCGQFFDECPNCKESVLRNSDECPSCHTKLKTVGH